MKKFILGMAGCMVALPVYAGLYDVSSVFVDVEAENAVRAKEAALSEAAVLAFPKLLEKIVLRDGFKVYIDIPKESDKKIEGEEKKVSQEDVSRQFEPLVEAPENGVVITPDEISGFVQGMSVAKEKNTSTRYMADVTVRFNSKEIQTYLTQRQIPFLSKEPPQMIIVPIFRENQNVMVFDEESPLFSSLKENIPTSELHTFVVPRGDMVDISAIVPDVLGGTNYVSLDVLRNKYKTKMVLIVDVNKQNNVYTVKTIEYPQNASAGANVTFVVSSRATNIEAVMTHIMKKTVDYMVHNFKDYHLHHASAGSKVVASFEVTNLAEWNSLEKRLLAFSFVDKTNVQAIHKNQVFAELVFSEGVQTALDKMEKGGFVLVPQYANMYVWKR
ncbi:MAG: DUF2066 domain-containing protein [Alphaproteobacteria bacterium]|nr:DUF2066 domain-containing protein [Alphaproteobacteria bacterium]